MDSSGSPTTFGLILIEWAAKCKLISGLQIGKWTDYAGSVRMCRVAPPVQRSRSGVRNMTNPDTWLQNRMRFQFPNKSDSRGWQIPYSTPYIRYRHRSSVIGHRSSVIGHRSSVIGHRSSVIGHRSAIGHRSSVIGHRSSVIGDR